MPVRLPGRGIALSEAEARHLLHKYKSLKLNFGALSKKTASASSTPKGSFYVPTGLAPRAASTLPVKAPTTMPVQDIVQVSSPVPVPVELLSLSNRTVSAPKYGTTTEPKPEPLADSEAILFEPPRLGDMVFEEMDDPGYMAPLYTPPTRTPLYEAAKGTTTSTKPKRGSLQDFQAESPIWAAAKAADEYNMARSVSTAPSYQAHNELPPPPPSRVVYQDPHPENELHNALQEEAEKFEELELTSEAEEKIDQVIQAIEESLEDTDASIDRDYNQGALVDEETTQNIIDLEEALEDSGLKSDTPDWSEPSVELIEPAWEEPSSDDMLPAEAKSGFPWWLLLVAAGGGYYMYKKGKQR